MNAEYRDALLERAVKLLAWILALCLMMFGGVIVVVAIFFSRIDTIQQLEQTSARLVTSVTVLKQMLDAHEAEDAHPGAAARLQALREQMLTDGRPPPSDE